ncbi:hypothetical protein ACQKWADRAFT_312374 [Trichoderma austrokoningii]
MAIHGAAAETGETADRRPSARSNSSQFSGSRSEDRKRRAGDPLQDLTPSKKLKSSGTVHRPWNFPPEFYDNLSKVWLTPLALQELDRRNDQNPPPSVFSSSRQTQSTKPTTLSTKRSTAYDANFRQHCEDYHIYPPFYRFPDGRRPQKPANLDEIRHALRVPRASLSPSVASESAFEEFQFKNTIKSEDTVMRNIIPLIAGDADILNEGHLPFTNLASITKNSIVYPYPDFFDGAHPEAVDQEVREALDKIIIPTEKANAPIAPNLFLEAKSSGGTLDVAEGQVILDGAHGTIIMHTLQNHLLEEPVYDGNAYTFTATFIGGYLNLYAHHPTAPAEVGQNPGCHITQLNAYALTGNYEGWLKGIGAFRNLRKLAKRYRDQFIEAVNARVHRKNAEVAIVEEDGLAAEKQQNEGSSP